MLQKAFSTTDSYLEQLVESVESVLCTAITSCNISKGDKEYWLPSVFVVSA